MLHFLCPTHMQRHGVTVCVVFICNCFPKMKDFSKLGTLQAVTYTVKVEVARKWCKIDTLFLHTSNRKYLMVYRLLPFLMTFQRPWMTLKVIHLLQYLSSAIRPTSLHAICWPVDDCSRYQSQRDTGLRTRTSVLRCHSCWSASVHNRQPQRTQARDAKKSSKSASGQLRIIWSWTVERRKKWSSKVVASAESTHSTARSS